MDSATRITNLPHRYAELMDSGALEACAALFAGARLTLAGGHVVEGAAPMLATWRQWVRIYPCGTPRTRHLVSNVQLDIAEAAGTATARSYYTVFQQTEVLPLQAICAGRYHDSFVRDEAGAWHFATRDYSLLDMTGDLSQHLLQPVAATAH